MFGWRLITEKEYKQLIELQQYHKQEIAALRSLCDDNVKLQQKLLSVEKKIKKLRNHFDHMPSLRNI